MRNDHIRYLEAYEELKSGEKNVELAARNYHTTATRFAEGMALITDMLDAANSRLDAEQQLVNARTDFEAKKARYETMARQRSAASTAADETRLRIAQTDAGIELVRALLETASTSGEPRSSITPTSRFAL